MDKVDMIDFYFHQNICKNSVTVWFCWNQDFFTSQRWQRFSKLPENVKLLANASRYIKQFVRLVLVL